MGISRCRQRSPGKTCLYSCNSHSRETQNELHSHVDCGDNVIVINAGKVSLSGNKWKQKQYIRHTGYPGGQRSLNAEQLNAKGPERLIENAVRGMLPKNKLGAALFRNLKVFAGSEHSHEAQKPKTINIKEHK